MWQCYYLVSLNLVFFKLTVKCEAKLGLKFFEAQSSKKDDQDRASELLWPKKNERQKLFKNERESFCFEASRDAVFSVLAFTREIVCVCVCESKRV